MRLLVLASAVGAVGALGLVTAANGSSEGERALTEARVCGADAFSTGGARCIVDERAGLRSNVLHCSARARRLGGKRYTGVFRFRGKSFPARVGVVPGNGWIYISLRLPGGTFPAGRWACAIDSGGTTARASFSTAGDSGTLTSAAACPTTRTVATAGVRACRVDLSARRFPATSKITCSGHYSLAAGRVASVRLLYGKRPTGLSLERRLPFPVSVLGMQVAKGGGLPAGDYTCVFSLDGKTLGTRAFAIAPAPFVPPTR